MKMQLTIAALMLGLSLASTSMAALNGAVRVESGRIAGVSW